MDGFNGWNEVEGLDDMEVSTSGDDTAATRDVAMTPTGDGGLQATITLPTDGRALHAAFHDYVTDSWDNNGERDFGQAFELPYIGPYLSWNDRAQPHDGVVVSFETSLPCLGVVEYGTTTSLGTAAAGADFGTMHHVVLEDLEPGTDYHYKLWDAAGRSSQTYSFATATPMVSELSFVVMSDMQDHGEDNRWGDVAAEILANHPEAAFALIPGDMPNEITPGQWWTFFDRGRELFPGLPILTNLGNHDTPGIGSSTDTTDYEYYFALPTDADGVGLYYSVDYGKVHVVALNSEDSSAFARNTGEQYLWAEEDLNALWDGGVRQPDWVFAFWHIPPYNVGSRHQSEQDDFRDMTELFDGTVDWFFAGHEHLYQRMKPLQYSGVLADSLAYGLGPEDGVGYIVTPPAGNSPHTQVIATDHEDGRRRDRLAFPILDEDVYVESEVGYVTVDLCSTDLTLTVWGMGDLYESVPAWVRETYSYTR